MPDSTRRAALHRHGLILLALLLPGTSACQSTRRNEEKQPETVTKDRYEIRAEDDGTTFRYPVTGRFTVVLDSASYPKQDLRCEPQGIVGGISNVPDVPPPYYAARFEAVKTGTCTMKDRDFSVTIQVVAGTE